VSQTWLLRLEHVLATQVQVVQQHAGRTADEQTEQPAVQRKDRCSSPSDYGWALALKHNNRCNKKLSCRRITPKSHSCAPDISIMQWTSCIVLVQLCGTVAHATPLLMYWILRCHPPNTCQIKSITNFRDCAAVRSSFMLHSVTIFYVIWLPRPSTLYV